MWNFNESENMMSPKDLLVRLKIPVPSLPIVNIDAMIFHRWLPTKNGDFFCFIEDDLELKLWFDVDCAPYITKVREDEPPEERIANWNNVTARFLYIDIIIRNQSIEFSNYILSSLEPDHLSTHGEIYKEIGVKILALAQHYTNRLISYFKYEKGQYWLEEYNYGKEDSDYYTVKFKAKVKENNSGDSVRWIRWTPPFNNSVTINVDNSVEKYVTYKEWPDVLGYLKSKQRPNLVNQLLSNAKSLAGQNHRRSSLIEAITALEVAVNDFSKHPDFSKVNANNFNNRIDQASLKNQVQHLGFSSTLRFLLPVIFNEEELSQSLLNNCYEAITVRGNVVHNGQRDVDEKKLSTYLNAIIKVCEILKSYQKKLI